MRNVFITLLAFVSGCASIERIDFNHIPLITSGPVKVSGISFNKPNQNEPYGVKNWGVMVNFDILIDHSPKFKIPTDKEERDMYFKEQRDREWLYTGGRKEDN